jgi:hypothetical protein
MAVTVQDHNNMSRVERLFDDLRRYALLIGIFGEDDSEMVQIAIWNEFGTSKIPERSFLRAGFDANQSRIEQICEMALDEVLEGVDGSSQFDVASMYDQIGLQVADIIREYLTDLRSPPNAPSTIKLKGSSNPLIDTGHLRSSIVWKVVTV